MERKVSEINTSNLKYIHFYAYKDDAHIEFDSRWLKDFNKDIHYEQWLHFADKLWEHTLKLFVALCGFDMNAVRPGRWKMSENGHSIKRSFNSPLWGTVPYKSLTAIIHLRDSFISERSIDQNFIDLFLMFDLDPCGQEHLELANDEDVIYFLIDQELQITNALTGIAQTVTEDSSVQVITMAPVWEEECVVVYGGDGYWIKGVLA